MRNSKILLCKGIKLDKSYKNVLSYTNTQMLNLCMNDAHLIKSADNYSFIKKGINNINTSFSYSECLRANYIAFQNPDYDNKWFFAFIDKITYNGEKNTNIQFTIDVWSTFYEDVDFQECFVIREHVNDDTIGAHTLPENVETGEYAMITAPVPLNNYDTGTYICVAVSEMIPEVLMDDDDNKRTFNGIYNGLYFCIHTDAQYATNLINIYDRKGKADAINSVFLVPKQFALLGDPVKAKVGVVQFADTNIKFSFLVPESGNNYFIIEPDIYVNNVTALNGGYIPKNNKLFTKQFNYMILTNNNGTDVPLYYENFTNGLPHFKVIGDITPGCSIKCIPLDYNNFEDTDSSMASYNFGISGGKFPVCSWNSDAYTNWLTENGVNLGLSLVGAVVGAGIGIATGGVGLVVAGSAAMSIASTMGSIYQHSMTPDQAKGNTNVGDVTYSAKKNVFDVIRMSIKPEYARCIDDYFTRLGYKVNTLKHPNITGRRYWNYIQVSNSDYLVSGNLSHEYLEIINNIGINGVTIWHNHDSIGNYSLDNEIVA